MPELELIVNSVSYAGWKAAVVSRDLQRVASDFELETTDTWPGALGQRVVRPGDEVQLRYGPAQMLAGYVDVLKFSTDAESRKVTIAGRSKTGDLVDCSTTTKPGQWRGQRFEGIAFDLLIPFKIGLSADVDTGPAFPSFATNMGESVHDVLLRAALARGLMLTDDAMGNLLITRGGGASGATNTALVLGENVLSIDAEFDHRDRFSEYVFKGQYSARGFGDDSNAASARTQAKSVAVDLGVKRYRPLIVVPSISSRLANSARMEASVRAAESMKFQVKVQGWLDGRGDLWEVNRSVAFVDEWIGIDAVLLIASVRFEINHEGTTTTLGLVPGESFAMTPLTKGAAEPFWTEVQRKR